MYVQQVRSVREQGVTNGSFWWRPRHRKVERRFRSKSSRAKLKECFDPSRRGPSSSRGVAVAACRELPGANCREAAAYREVARSREVPGAAYVSLDRPVGQALVLSVGLSPTPLPQKNVRNLFVAGAPHCSKDKFRGTTTVSAGSCIFFLLIPALFSSCSGMLGEEAQRRSGLCVERNISIFVVA